MIGLISQLTTTAKLTEQKIYDNWNGLFYTLSFSLLENYKDGNSFNLKSPMALSTITSFVLSFNLISYKALDGFTLIEIAESIMTQTLIHNGLQQTTQSKGLLGGLTSLFGGKKG